MSCTYAKRTVTYTCHQAASYIPPTEPKLGEGAQTEELDSFRMLCWGRAGEEVRGAESQMADTDLTCPPTDPHVALQGRNLRLGRQTEGLPLRYTLLGQADKTC